MGKISVIRAPPGCQVCFGNIPTQSLAFRRRGFPLDPPRHRGSLLCPLRWQEVDPYKKPQSGHRRQCGEVYPYFALRFTARKPDSGKVCVARGSSISRFSNADRRVSGRIRTAGSLERHQLGRTGSATLTLENNRESYSCSRAEGRLKQRPRPLSTALLARKFQRAKGTKAKGLTACSPLA